MLRLTSRGVGAQFPRAVSHTPHLVPLAGIALPASLPSSSAGDHQRSYESPKKAAEEAWKADCLGLEKGDKPRVEIDAPLLSGYIFPDKVVQVLNTKTKMVHLSAGSGVACNCWKAGTPEQPSATAEWATGVTRWSPDKNPYTFCVGCHGAEGLARIGAKLRVADADLSDAESSKSESNSSSSASSHRC